MAFSKKRAPQLKSSPGSFTWQGSPEQKRDAASRSNARAIARNKGHNARMASLGVLASPADYAKAARHKSRASAMKGGKGIHHRPSGTPRGGQFF